MAAPYITPESVKFMFTSLGIVATDADEGLISFSFTPNGDTVEIGSDLTVNGTQQIIRRLNNSGDLSIVATRGSELDKKLKMIGLNNAKLTGFLTDMTNEVEVVSYTLATCGLVKPTLATSVENITYIIRGHIITKSI